jgi:hypothetical protein
VLLVVSPSCLTSKTARIHSRRMIGASIGPSDICSAGDMCAVGVEITEIHTGNLCIIDKQTGLDANMHLLLWGSCSVECTIPSTHIALERTRVHWYQLQDCDKQQLRCIATNPFSYLCLLICRRHNSKDDVLWLGKVRATRQCHQVLLVASSLGYAGLPQTVQ